MDIRPDLRLTSGWIEQLELLVGQRLAQVELEDAARFDDLRHLVAEEAEGAAAVGLGAVQRHVGVLQQRVGADAARGHGDADAGADLDQMIVDLVTLAQAIDDAPGKARGVFGRMDVLLEHHELVAAEARHEILRPQHLAQPVGDRAQQLVAAGMAERVVDLLELVEVDEQQRRQLFGALLGRQKTSDLVAEIDPVGQCGEFVIARQMADPGFRILALGDVLDQHDGAAAGHRLEGPGQRAVLADVRIGRGDIAGRRVLDFLQNELARSPADIVPAATQAATDVRRVGAALHEVVGQVHHLAEAVIHDREPAVGAKHAQAMRHVVQRGIELTGKRRLALARNQGVDENFLQAGRDVLQGEEKQYVQQRHADVDRGCHRAPAPPSAGRRPAASAHGRSTAGRRCGRRRPPRSTA